MTSTRPQPGERLFGLRDVEWFGESGRRSVEELRRTPGLRLLRPYTSHPTGIDLELARSVDRLADASASHARRLDELERR